MEEVTKTVKIRKTDLTGGLCTSGDSPSVSRVTAHVRTHDPIRSDHRGEWSSSSPVSDLSRDMRGPSRVGD